MRENIYKCKSWYMRECIQRIGNTDQSCEIADKPWWPWSHISNHPSTHLCLSWIGAYRGNYLAIVAVVLNCIQVNVDNAALVLCSLHLTLDHALWSERFNKLQLTTQSVTNNHTDSDWLDHMLCLWFALAFRDLIVLLLCTNCSIMSMFNSNVALQLHDCQQYATSSKQRNVKWY